eukprot:258869-Amphidinium_carterae.1
MTGRKCRRPLLCSPARCHALHPRPLQRILAAHWWDFHDSPIPQRLWVWVSTLRALAGQRTAPMQHGTFATRNH